MINFNDIGVRNPSPINSLAPILVTYAEILALKQTNTLFAQRNYIITDRNIEVFAMSKNLLSPEGIHYRNVGSRGSIGLTGGTQGSVETILMGTFNVLGPFPVPFNVSLTQTAADVAARITAFGFIPPASTQPVSAFSHGTQIYIVGSPDLAETLNSLAVTGTVSANPGDNLVLGNIADMGNSGAGVPGIIPGVTMINNIIYDLPADEIVIEKDHFSNTIIGGLDSFCWNAFNPSISVIGNTVLDESQLFCSKNIGNIVDNFLANDSILNCDTNAGTLQRNSLFNHSNITANLAAIDSLVDTMYSNSGQIGTGQIINVNIHLMAAQIKSLGAAFTLIPAPGAGKFIAVSNIEESFTPGVVPYVTTPLIYKILGESIELFDSGIILTSLSAQFNNSIIAPPAPPQSQLGTNEALVVITNNAVNPTLGDGTLDIYITYQIKNA